jgi:hypothetical protein
VAVIAQGGNQAIDGPVGELLRLQHRAIDKIILGQLPNFPEYAKLIGLILRHHNRRPKAVGVAQHNPGAKGHREHNNQNNSSQPNLYNFFH